MSSPSLPMIACLALGVADLAFIDAWVLPRALAETAPVTQAAPRPVGRPPVTITPLPAEAPSPSPAPALALTIHFSTGGSELSPRAQAAVEALAAQVAGHPGWRLSVEGHADARGDDALNERLSQERARAVSEQLRALGLPGSRLSTAAFGATRPLSEADDPAALRRNRRVEVLIVRGEP